MTLRAELHEVHTHLRADEHQRHAHLRGIADEGQLAVFDLLALGQVLHHGKQVAKLLRGMVELGHAVDNGARAILRQVGNILVAVNASHKDVNQAAHDASGVLDGLMAAQLDGARTVELRMAAQVGHSGFERDAGAGGHLLEDHAQRLVLQDLRVAAALFDHGLHRACQLDHVEQLFFGEVVSVDVVLLSHCGILLMDRLRPRPFREQSWYRHRVRRPPRCLHRAFAVSLCWLELCGSTATVVKE